MDKIEVYRRSLLAQYHVFQLEKIIFTIFFILAMLLIPIAWAFIHLYHNTEVGYLIAFVALVLGAGMATHAGNSIRTIKRIASSLNQEMGPEVASFQYDIGEETGKVRFIVTLIGKIIGGLFLLWCFFPSWFRWLPF